jgi:FkbM family methyltransferase
MESSLACHNLLYRLLTTSCKTLRVGSDAAWHIKEGTIGSRSFVISGGAGHDISFELQLVKETGCQLILLDPSPTGRTTVSKLDLPSSIIFEPLALSDWHGALSMARPLNSSEGSWRIDTSGGGDTVQSTTIDHLMDRYGVKKVDLLKIDIEGFEYPVLQDALRRKLPIKQICVEIHQGPEFGVTRGDRWALIFRLLRTGYRLVHHEGWDHTFIHKSA